MIFTSYKFLAFFAVVLCVYYIIPKKFQWIWLLLASAFFYYCSSPVFMIFLTASIIITYSTSIIIDHINSRQIAESAENNAVSETMISKNRLHKKKIIVCIIGVLLNVGILAYTKYVNFLGKNLSSLLGKDFNAIQVIVPLGISFYTFQTVAYCADVYKGVCKPQKNIFKYAFFISFFPQILQGPIARYNDLAQGLFEKHKFNYDAVKSGLLRMLWGFWKKMVIADRTAIFVNTIFDNYQNYNGIIIAIAAIMYMLQLYTDFSGYMDIAIGAGEALGITMSENFNTPFFSRSIPEFWRRWHVTLGSWFRDYIYIPLGGNRKGKFRTIINLFVVWILTGVWHGASWNFVAWGLGFGLLIIASRLFSPLICKIVEKLKIKTDCFSYHAMQSLRTSLLVCFIFIFFRADGCMAALTMIKNMFISDNPFKSILNGTLFQLGIDAKDIRLLAISVMILIFVSIANYKGIKVRKWIMEQNLVFQWLVYLCGIFAVLIFGIYGIAYNAGSFIYFGF